MIKKVTAFHFILAILATATAVFVSNGIYFIWPLAWISSLPILIILPRIKPLHLLFTAFMALSLGLSVQVWMLRNTMPVPIAIISFMAYAFILSIVFLITRCLINRINHYMAVFIFPTAWTVIEYLLYTLNPNGRWGSFAYTQTDFLPVIQIVSVAGIWGIVFLLSLFSSLLSFLWNYRAADRHHLIKISLMPIGLMIMALCFGCLRLAQKVVGNIVKAGLIATDNEIRFFKTQKAEEALPIIEAYSKKIKSLAAQGADVVVLPEKTVGITDDYSTEAKKIFSNTARNNQITVVVGVNILGSTPWKNRAWIFAPDGQLVMEYDKHHLIQGWERGKYEIGKKPGIFPHNKSLWGVLICKDNDFPSYSRLYGERGVKLMLSPSWDFIYDAEYHSRMAIMRAIENGYTLVRSTKEGYSTISDQFGRVLFSKATFIAEEVHHVIEAREGTGNTFYSQTGDWFARLTIILLFLFIVIALRRKPSKTTT